MKKHIKKWLAAAVLLLIVLIACAAQADEHYLYVNVTSNSGSVTFRQKKAPLIMVNSKDQMTTEMHYANYSIYRDVATGKGGLKIYDFNKSKVTINLSKGQYLLHVESGDLSEIKEKIDGVTWKGLMWQGSAPGWYLDDYSGCTVKVNTAASPDFRYQNNAVGLSTVAVTHMTVDGLILSTEDVTLSSGTYQLAPRQNFTGYVPASTATQTVTVSGGTASPSYVVFMYTAGKNAATTAAAGGTGYTPYGTPVKIRVKYVSDDGYWNLKGTPVTAMSGSTIKVCAEFTTHETEWGTYELSGANEQSVTVAADGTPSTKTVTFTFTKKAKQNSFRPISTTGNHVTATGRVNVRKGPGVEYDIITDMATGDVGEYLGSEKASNGQLWYKTRIVKNNREYIGWVSSKYAKAN